MNFPLCILPLLFPNSTIINFCLFLEKDLEPSKRPNKILRELGDRARVFGGTGITLKFKLANKF